MEKVLSDDTFLFWDLRPDGLKPSISPDLPEGSPSGLEEASSQSSAASQAPSSADMEDPAAQSAPQKATQAQASTAPASQAPESRAEAVPAGVQAPAPGHAMMPGHPAGAEAPMMQKAAAEIAMQGVRTAPSMAAPAAPEPAEPMQDPAGEAPVGEASYSKPPEAQAPFGGDPQFPSYPGWHLRKKRADVFVDLQSGAPFLKPLCDYLKSKGLSVLGYDPKLHYLPYDVILADKARLGTEGRCAALDGGKAAVWAFLKRSFAGRL